MGDQSHLISARIDAWRKTGDLSALWPHVDSAARAEAHRLITATTHAVLIGGGETPRLESTRLIPPEAIGIAAYVCGMGALLGHWIEQRTIVADSPLRDLLREHLAHGRRRAANMTAGLVTALGACDRNGVKPTVLKGSHTSHAYFPEPGTRPSADLDLLVPPNQFEVTGTALRAAGFAESRRTRTPPRSEWITQGAPMPLRSLELDHADNPWSIDLHQALERWYFRGLRAGFLPEFWKTRPLDIGGQRALVLAQPLLTAFLAMHAAFSIRDVRLIHLVELVLVIRHDALSGALDWQELALLLAATRTARFVYPSLELVDRLAPGTVDPRLRLAFARTSTRRMRRVIDAVHRAGMRLPRRTLDEKLMWACGAWELLCNIGELVWSSDEALPASEVVRLHLRRARMVLRGQAGFSSQAR